MNDFIDLHMHTIASGHAYNTLYEMVAAAVKNGVTMDLLCQEVVISLIFLILK